MGEFDYCKHEWAETRCGNRCIKCGECESEKEGARCRYLQQEGRTATTKSWICIKDAREVQQAEELKG